jgi:hypothetical protein
MSAANTERGIIVARLSRLQKQILTLAYDRIQEPLYYSEVLEELYGFLPAVGGEHALGNARFDRLSIGLQRYAAAVAAVSRSMDRLESRGLILCLRGSNNRRHGCSLTAKGLQFMQWFVHETVNTQVAARTKTVNTQMLNTRNG